jgi:VWFA-related protein
MVSSQSLAKSLAILALVQAVRLHAQTPGDDKPAVIRVEAREVLVDVTVTGRKGASTGNLAAQDFTIWEDGKPQKINGMSNASADPEASQKHFVLIFDFRTMPLSEQAASKRYAAAFIDGVASPDRYMAIVSLDPSGSRIIQDFTTAKAALKNAIEFPLNGSGPGINGQQATVFGTQVVAANVRPFAETLKAVADSVAPAPGRKAVLVFTGGYLGGETSAAVKAAITACNRSNVAVYVIGGNAGPVVTGGVNADQSVRPQALPLAGYPNRVSINPGVPPNATFAHVLAESTGGEVFGLTGNLPAQLAAVAREQDEYYRISYTPPPAKEGSCHTLRVKVNVRGLGTKARNEYCTEKPVDLVAGRIAGQGLESRAARPGAGTLDATMQLPYFYTGTNRASVHLSLEVVPAGIEFQKGQGGLHGQIDLVGTASRPDGGTAARFADTIGIDMEDQQHADRFRRARYHYEHQFLVAAGKYVFRMAIGASPSAVGKVEMPLEVEPWNSASFGIGGIAFSTDVQPLEPVPAAGGPILEGRTPLVAVGRRFIPAGTTRFRRSDQLYFYTEVYDPALSGENPAIDQSVLTMEYRVLDRRTGEVRQATGMAGVASYIRPGNPLVPFATRLALSQLPAGQYRLEVRAGHSTGQQTVARTADFDLN